MTVRVRYFAVLRDRRGLECEVTGVGAQTAGTVVEELLAKHALGLPRALVRVAVNGSFVADDHPLSDGDEVVLVPPVAGG